MADKLDITKKANESLSATQSETIAIDQQYEELLRKIASEENTSIINILSNYDWAVNYKKENSLLPRAYVHEYRQNVSTFAATLAYYSTGVKKAVIGSILDTLNIGSSTSTLPTGTSNKFNAILATNDNRLNPYKNMYYLDDTNCLKYVFPYFDSGFIDISNSYGDQAQSATSLEKQVDDFVQGHLVQATGLIGDLYSLGGLFGNKSSWDNSGIFVERPKYFQFDTNGDSVTLRFTLYNTVYHDNDFEPWKKNFRFIKNFALKNLPYKISMFRYRTPTLYEVSIPGVKYLPLSYVKSFNVSMQGTRRFMNYNENGNNINAIIPDAWDVSITFQSLLAKTANTFYTALNKGPNITTVSSAQNLLNNLQVNMTTLGKK